MSQNTSATTYIRSEFIRNESTFEKSQIFSNLAKNTIIPAFYAGLANILIQVKNIMPGTVCETLATAWNERSLTAVQNCTAHVTEFVSSPETFSTATATATNFLSIFSTMYGMAVWGFLAQATYFILLHKKPDLNAHYARGLSLALSTSALAFSFHMYDETSFERNLALTTIVTGVVCTKVLIPVLKHGAQVASYVFKNIARPLSLLQWDTEVVSFFKPQPKVIISHCTYPRELTEEEKKQMGLEYIRRTTRKSSDSDSDN